MATYDYRCRECDGIFEIRRSVTDDGRQVRCPDGHGDVVRIWSAVGVLGSATVAAGTEPAPSAGGCCGGGCCG